MKKVLPIVLSLLLLLTATCFAKYQIDYDKWKPVPNQVSLYWDKSTAQYSDDGNTVTFRICLVHPKGKEHVFSTYRMTREPRTVTALHYEEYKGDKLIKEHKISPEEEFTHGIHPNDLHEDLYCAVFSVNLPSDKARWQEVFIGEKNSYFIDRSSLKYSANGNIATFWLRQQTTETAHIKLYRYEQLDKSAQTHTTLYTHWYSDSGSEYDFVYIPKEIKEQKYANDNRYYAMETTKIKGNALDNIFHTVFPN